MTDIVFAERLGSFLRSATPELVRMSPRSESPVETKASTSGYLLANGVDRLGADRLRREHPGSVVSRNADGTYRVTRAR